MVDVSVIVASSDLADSKTSTWTNLPGFPRCLCMDRGSMVRTCVCSSSYLVEGD